MRQLTQRKLAYLTNGRYAQYTCKHPDNVRRSRFAVWAPNGNLAGYVYPNGAFMSARIDPPFLARLVTSAILNDPDRRLKDPERQRQMWNAVRHLRNS